MVGGPVDFIPGYPLFYTNRGQKKMYELLGVRTQLEFTKYVGRQGGMSNEDMEKIITAGVTWNHPDITVEQVEELIENEYYIKGNGSLEELNDLVTEAFASSGLLNKDKIEIAKKIMALKEKKTLDELEKMSDGRGDEPTGNR